MISRGIIELSSQFSVSINFLTLRQISYSFRVIIFIICCFVSYIKVDNKNMRVAELKAIAREHGLRGYSRLRKTEFIALLQNDLRPTPAPRPIPAPRTRPPRPTRPPPPSPSVRFRPDRPRQPELLRKLEERNP